MVQAAQEPQAVFVQPGSVVQQTGLLTRTGAQTVALQGAAQVGSGQQPLSFLLKQEKRPFFSGVAQVGSQTVAGAHSAGAQPLSFLLKQEKRPFFSGVAQVGSQTVAGAHSAGAQPLSFLLKQEKRPFFSGVAQVGSQTEVGAHPAGAQPLSSFLLKQENKPRGFGELAHPAGAQAESPQTGFVLQTVFGAQAELVVQIGAGAAQPHSASFLKQSNSPA